MKITEFLAGTRRLFFSVFNFVTRTRVKKRAQLHNHLNWRVKVPEVDLNNIMVLPYFLECLPRIQ